MQEHFKSAPRQLSKYIFNIYNGPIDHCVMFILQLVVEITFISSLSKDLINFNWIPPFPKIKLNYLRMFSLGNVMAAL